LSAKARHREYPRAYADYLDVIQCFCFIQQTLRPGEEASLPLVLSLAADLPPAVRELTIRYEFYPLDSFPSE
ncbi:MAG: cytochrome c oxidase assembly protein, partial [Ardenticatenaceae bacterium]